MKQFNRKSLAVSSLRGIVLFFFTCSSLVGPVGLPIYAQEATPAAGSAIPNAAPASSGTASTAAPVANETVARPGKREKKIVAPPGTPAESTAARGPIVRNIHIEFIGPHSVAESVILSNMRTTVGQPYTPSSVEEDVRNLYATGNFTNLQIRDNPFGDGVEVLVLVQAKPVIKDIVIRGTTNIKESRVKKEIKSKVADRLNEAQISADSDKIKELYLNKGFNQVQVSYKIDTNDNFGRSVVTFIINEGAKSYVSEVDFVGNDHLTTKELRKILKTRKKNFFSFINKSGLYKEDDFRNDLSALRDYYFSRGYIDMSVKDVRYQYPEPNKMKVVITLFEGIQYRVGKISFTGNTVFTEAELRVFRGTPVIRMTEGSVYVPKAFTPKDKKPDEEAPSLENDLSRLEDLYGSRGYLNTGTPSTDISPIQQPNLESGKMDIVYSIQEGPQSYLEQIIIQGNGRTKDKVLRRELAVNPGELYDKVRADQSKKRLEAMGYFEKVDISPQDTTIPNRKNMVITVEEKRTGSITFGAGFSSVDSLLGFVEVTQGNFDLFNYPYFTGGGEKFRARLQYGLQRKDVTLSFKEPWFLEQRIALGYDLFYHDAQYLSNYYDQRNIGGTVSLERGFTQFISGSIGYTLQEIDLYNFQNGASEELRKEQGNRSESSVTLGLNFDSRDNPQQSRSGTQASLTSTFAGGPLLGQTNIYKFVGQIQNFQLLPYDIIFSIRAVTGDVDSYGNSQYVPIFDRFFVGGSTSVRGFSNRGIGPRDDTNEPLGGNTEGFINTEFTFPIMDRVRGSVFTDAGFLDAKAFNYTNAWRELGAASGVGLLLNLPIGPLRLYYGIPFKYDPPTSKWGKFSFDVGYQF